MNDKTTDLGEQYLLDNYEKCRLEVEYDYDCDEVFIQLRDMSRGTCTVLDGSDIFRQVQEFVSRQAKNEPSKRYRIELNDEAFMGTAEDVARWYCKQKSIKLLMDGGDGVPPTLYAHLPNVKSLSPKEIYTFDIEEDVDFEAGYRMFFSEYMLKANNPDYCLTECHD